MQIVIFLIRRVEALLGCYLLVALLTVVIVVFCFTSPLLKHTDSSPRNQVGRFTSFLCWFESCVRNSQCGDLVDTHAVT